MAAHAPPADQVTVLDRIFAELRDEDHIARLQSATELQHVAFHTLPTLPPDLTARLWGEIVNARLSELIFSQTSAAQLGGVLAIDYLLSADATSDALDLKPHLFRFYNYVQYLLPSPAADVMQAASTALGRILEVGGVPKFGDRFVAYEVPAAVKLLQHDAEASRCAGVLVLTQLARKSPAFEAHAETVLPDALEVLRDPSVVVRERGAELLGACLDLVVSSAEGIVVLEILRDARTGLASPEPTVVHGSVLALREVLLHGGGVVDDSVQDVADAVAELSTHADVHVGEAANALVPVLAMHRNDQFAAPMRDSGRGAVDRGLYDGEPTQTS